MQNTSERYLREVLGVTSIVLSADEISAPTQNRGSGHFQVTGDFEARTAVVSFSQVSLSERELCQKMLMAVGAGSLLIIEFASPDDVEAIQEFFGAYKGQAIWSFGTPSAEFLKSANERRVLTLPALSELTDQSDPVALMAKKRDVWARLQSFQKGEAI